MFYEGNISKPALGGKSVRFPYDLDMAYTYQRGIKFVGEKIRFRSSLGKIAQISPIRQLWRGRIASKYMKPQKKSARRWIWKRTETSNFYYDLTDSNRLDLAHLISLISGATVSEVKGYIEELASDIDLRNHIKKSWESNPRLKDAYVGFGRREGWYAIVRSLKPKLVIETGVSHGIGACVIASAVLRNRTEGYEGQYLGTDWDPDAGVLLSGIYAEAGEIVYGDSISTLEKIDGSIELFINDSDHSFEYEAREYSVIQSKLSTQALVLGDNSHVSPSLRTFSELSNRRFVFFKEIPKDHWYPGAGIGISLPPLEQS